MSFKSLGNKQTIVLHNYEIDHQKYDLVITPHTQTVEYIRTNNKKKNYKQTKTNNPKKIFEK